MIDSDSSWHTITIRFWPPPTPVTPKESDAEFEWLDTIGALVEAMVRDETDGTGWWVEVDR